MDDDQDSNESEDSNQDVEGKLIKRIQYLQSERDRLAETVERADNEVEMLRSVLDEIKFDICKNNITNLEFLMKKCQSIKYFKYF